MDLNVVALLDGENEPPGFRQIVASWLRTWQQYYGQNAALSITVGGNLKHASTRSGLSDQLKGVIEIRNPDIFFVESARGLALGGVEITAHSPDGSNVDKRYPYLWASFRAHLNGIIVCPYSKQRSNLQVNRLPNRHSQRNAQFLDRWTPGKRGEDVLCQIVPVRELQGETISSVPDGIRQLLPAWQDLGRFYAHTLAAMSLRGAPSIDAVGRLLEFKVRLAKLAAACQDNTHETDPTSLYKTPSRWIQTYNCRPDIGHWERGEGQFDSIDGRLMFTLDDIGFLRANERPNNLEFWLPQMVSNHPWVAEQETRGYGSKRFRNIRVLLKDMVTTRFADELTDADWRLLSDNPSLTLERLDWEPGIYRVVDLIPSKDRREVATAGLGTNIAPPTMIRNIQAMLEDERLYFSSHRAYKPDWQSDIAESIRNLPRSAVVIAPRIPRRLLAGALSGPICRVIPAEECTKDHLMMLRQIHRCCRGEPPDDQVDA